VLSAAVLAALLVVGCTTGKEVVEPDGEIPSWESVHPHSAVLHALEATIQLQTVDSNGTPVAVPGIEWRSLEPGVAQVNGAGLVEAVAAGDARIVSESDTHADTALVHVQQDVYSVSVSPLSATLAINGTQTVTATSRDSTGHEIFGRTVTWTSSADATATVSGAGLVTGRAAGTATITAKVDKATATMTVTVTSAPPAPVASVSLSPATASITVGGTRQLTPTLRDASGNVLTGRAVEWSTNASAIATVSSGGLVAARAAGSATITARSEGVSGTAVITVTAPPTNLTTYYVSPSGSDANPGTESAPFRTIQKAADVVQPGNEVIVEDGTWTDTDGDGSIVNIDRGGTSASPIVFRSRNKWGAKLDGQNGQAAQGIDFNNGIGWVRVEGFEIFGVANVGSPRGSASGVDAYDGGHDSWVVGNHIHHIGRVCTNSGNTNGEVGIFVQQPNLTIEENLIHDIGRFFPGENGCSYTGGFTGYQTLDHGIYLNGGSPGADGALIRNNIFYNTRHGWAIQWYPGTLDNIRVLNNTFAYGNPNKNYTHIVLDADISNSSIINNIFYNPEAGETIEAGGFEGAITIANNITTGSAMSDRSTVPSGMTLTNNRLNTDALFVNAAGGDFHLQAGSPAIDAGQTLTLVPLDFERRARPRGAGFDIGALER
jgi:uncharacterized protein YjdB